MSPPRIVSLVGLIDREAKCRARIVREHTTVTKVRYWMGDGWSDVQDAHPDTVVHDGGRMAGWAAANHTDGIQR